MERKVRSATQNDISKLIDVYSEWQKFKGILPDQLIEVDTPEGLKKYFDGSNPTRIYLLAVDEAENPLGACYIDTSFLGLSSIRLGNMMVKEKHRQQGVGSILIDQVIHYAKENKVKKVWLWAQEELKTAVKLYESKGFTLEGRQKNQFCNKDALLLGLVLSE